MKKLKNLIAEKYQSMLIIMINMFFITNNAFAQKLENTKMVTGTEKLFEDATTAITKLSVVVGTCFIIYFMVRRHGADETDQKRWKDRAKLSGEVMVGVVVIKGVIQAVLSYYK